MATSPMTAAPGAIHCGSERAAFSSGSVTDGSTNGDGSCSDAHRLGAFRSYCVEARMRVVWENKVSVRE
jgi:hypothetical protein